MTIAPPPGEPRTLLPSAPDRPLLLVGTGAAARLAGTAAGAVFGLATTALAVRLLGPASYGLLAFALSMMVIVASFVRMGLEAGTTRTIAFLGSSKDEEGFDESVRGVYSLAFFSGLAGACIVCVALVLIRTEIGLDTRVALGVGAGSLLFGSNYVAATFSLARGLSRVAAAEIPYLALGLGKLAVVAIAVFLGTTDVAWIALGYGAAGLVAAIASMRLGRALVRTGVSLSPSLGAARRLVPLFIPYAIANFTTYSLSRLDVMVLGISHGSRDVGLYEPVLRVTEHLMVLVPVLIGSQFLPVATRLSAAGHGRELRRVFAGATKLGYVFGLPAILILAVFPRSVVVTLFGDSFGARPELVWILLVGFAANVLGGPNTGALLASGHRRSLIRAYAGSFVIVVASATVLIPLFGMVGAAVATSASFVVLNVVCSWSFWKVTGIHAYRGDVGLTMVTSLVPLSGLFVARAAVGDDSLLWASLLTIVAWTLWVVALLGTGLVDLPRLRGAGASSPGS